MLDPRINRKGLLNFDQNKNKLISKLGNVCDAVDQIERWIVCTVWLVNAWTDHMDSLWWSIEAANEKQGQE